jgi:hypothetical protein
MANIKPNEVTRFKLTIRWNNGNSDSHYYYRDMTDAIFELRDFDAIDCDDIIELTIVKFEKD